MQSVEKALQEALQQARACSMDLLLEKRFERLMGYGRFKEARTG
jgi:acetyl-CoA carboxylase carboxyl transferase subunit alpha